MSPKPIRLPADGLPHRAVVEWWYFNGHLSSGSKRYAFMNTLFKADAARALIPSLKNPFRSAPYAYFAHAVVSDIARKKSYKDIQPICRVSRDSFRRPLLFVDYMNPLSIARGHTNSEIAEITPGTFHIKTEFFDLQLVSRKKPLLEGGNGYISICGKHSYYYSLTDLAASGAIKIDEKWIKVNGKAWMDHQWANVSYSKDKWTWFSLQLEDGTDIMCVEYDDWKGKDYLADIMNADGRTEHYKMAQITPGKDIWKSKRTGAQYPMSWRIEIPGKKAVFEVRSLLEDQEMVSGALHYWEGPLAVRGKIRGRKMKGVGFMELAGYPADRSALVAAGEALYRNIYKEVSGKFGF